MSTPKEQTLYRSIMSPSHIVRTAIVLMLAMTFVVAAASPALAMSAAKRKAVIRQITVVAKKNHLSASEIKMLLKIAKMESSFRPTARNHSCKGLFQLKTHVSKKKWANVTWNTNRAIKYIKHRYGSVRRALRFHYAHGWY